MSQYGYGYESFYALFLIPFSFFMYILYNGNNKKNALITIFCILFLIAGMRGESVGGDLKRYIPEFHYIAQTTNISELLSSSFHEPLYILFVKTITLLSSDVRCFLVVTSFFSLLGPFIFFYRHSDTPLKSILLYYMMGYYTNTFNNIRQSLALSVFFFSITFLLNRDLYKYYICAIIAMLFHYSAVITLIIYPLYKQKYSIKIIILYAVGGISIISLLGFGIFRYVMMNILIKYDPESLLEDSSGDGYGLFMLYVLYFLFGLWLYSQNRDRLNNTQTAYVCMYLIMLTLSMAIQFSAPIFHSMVRMSSYYIIPAFTVGIPYMISSIKDGNKKLMFTLFQFTLALYFLRGTYLLNPMTGGTKQNVVPYVFLDFVLF